MFFTSRDKDCVFVVRIMTDLEPLSFGGGKLAYGFFVSNRALDIVLLSDSFVRDVKLKEKRFCSHTCRRRGLDLVGASTVCPWCLSPSGVTVPGSLPFRPRGLVPTVAPTRRHGRHAVPGSVAGLKNRKMSSDHSVGI